MAKTENTDDTDKSAVQRRVKSGAYKSFRLQKKVSAGPALPSAFKLFGRAIKVLASHWKLFGGMLVIYGLLAIVLVQGLGGSSGSLSETKDSLQEALDGNFGELTAGAMLFAGLLGASPNLAPAAGVYQVLVALVVSLALIWTLREVYAGHKVGVRDGFYRGMYPLVPFVLVLCVVGLQLIPLVIGGTLYTAVVSNGIAATVTETVLWGLIFFVLALISLYMLCSSLFALYIVCLPDMTPMRALRSARELVRNRRWTVLRKILFLPLALIVLGAIIMIPLIMLITPVASAVFFVLSLISLVVVHSYMYALYRSLL